MTQNLQKHQYCSAAWHLYLLVNCHCDNFTCYFNIIIKILIVLYNSANFNAFMRALKLFHCSRTSIAGSDYNYIVMHQGASCDSVLFARNVSIRHTSYFCHVIYHVQRMGRVVWEPIDQSYILYSRERFNPFVPAGSYMTQYSQRCVNIASFPLS